MTHRITVGEELRTDVQLAALKKAIAAFPASNPPAVTGAKGGNVALASLITALAALGLITDSTS